MLVSNFFFIFRCKLQLKSVLLAFQSIVNTEKTVESCIFEFKKVSDNLPLALTGWKLGKGLWTVNYTGSKSFITMLFFLLDQIFFDLYIEL